MLALTTEQREALEQREVMRRFFVWCAARDPHTGAPSPAGFWDDVGDVEHDGRTYHGSGSVISFSDLSAQGDLTLPQLTITLSGIDPEANALVRGKSIAQAPIQVKAGIFDPATHELIGPLFNYFIGFIDDCDIPTPEAGGEAKIIFTCRSTSSALEVASTATRSQASAAERDPDDGFYNYTAAASGAPVYFGRAAP